MFFNYQRLRADGILFPHLHKALFVGGNPRQNPQIMQDLIYYPNFESTNESWLKFALLYVDNLSPIIPPSGDAELSQLYYKLQNETDLLSFHRPEYQDGYSSSLDAIDIVERIMKTPERFDTFFNNEINPVRSWQDKSKFNYKLFEEKFSHEWNWFCRENNFAEQTRGGLLISEQLGTLYMVVLANTIADKNGKSPITDNITNDKLSFFLKSTAPKITSEILNAQAVINLKIPAKLEDITFDEIIKLRSSQNFKKYLKAFHSELNTFYENIEQGKTEEDFVIKYKNVLSDFTENILSLSIDTSSFGLGAGILLNSANYTNSDFFKTIVLAGTSLAVKSGFSLNKTWKNTEPKRHCRRYLSSLTKLH